MHIDLKQPRQYCALLYWIVPLSILYYSFTIILDFVGFEIILIFEKLQVEDKCAIK